MANPGNSNRKSKTNSERTMHIRFQSGDEQGVLETLRALDRGERPEPHLEVVFHDPDDLHRVVRPKNLELLRSIVQHEPESIRETARLVERDVRQVHTNLEELEELHLLEFEQAGRSKKPTVWYDSIELDLSLTDADSEAARA
ncbi:transcriptional regulator (plasmid) [Natrinema zhouii]|uniref:HVO_A0114 family putative DNA-binding protein n=1 Tax=Natrinema zhouii TaxID=1710539 RepID=UPI001CFFEA5F|nr:transcriptional regulator [Natrinema zhouii]UHQ98323.1 transcriptional regulator [Natrinema zhouii]